MTDQSEITPLGPMFDRIAADGILALEHLHLPAGAKVLDVGTGAGYFAAFLANQGFDVLTGEPETDMTHYAGKDWQDNAQKLGVAERIHFQSFDAANMPFADAAFDAVFFFGVLHHVDEASRHDVFREALRVVRAGGSVTYFEPRPEMLEHVRLTDPEHPDPANPADYAGAVPVDQRRIQGAMMDIYLYQPAAAASPA